VAVSYGRAARLINAVAYYSHQTVRLAPAPLQRVTRRCAKSRDSGPYVLAPNNKVR